MSDTVLLWGLTIVIAALVVDIAYRLGRIRQTHLCTETHVEIVQEMAREADELARRVAELEALLEDLAPGRIEKA